MALSGYFFEFFSSKQREAQQRKGVTDKIDSEVNVRTAVSQLVVSNGVNCVRTEITKKPGGAVFFSVVEKSSESWDNANRRNELLALKFSASSLSGEATNKNGSRTKQANVLRRLLFFNILALFSQIVVSKPKTSNINS